VGGKRRCSEEERSRVFGSIKFRDPAKERRKKGSSNPPKKVTGKKKTRQVQSGRKKGRHGNRLSGRGDGEEKRGVRQFIFREKIKPPGGRE